jgi:GDP-D-mannose dehydratase
MVKIKKKIALILGITGQDGSYLAEFLLKKKLFSSWYQKTNFNT